MMKNSIQLIFAGQVIIMFSSQINPSMLPSALSQIIDLTCYSQIRASGSTRYQCLAETIMLARLQSDAEINRKYGVCEAQPVDFFCVPAKRTSQTLIRYRRLQNRLHLPCCQESSTIPHTTPHIEQFLKGILLLIVFRQQIIK